ncbi:MAG: tyrosine-type recombinase/integrase [Nitriliruptorales bacterium]
MDQPTQPVRTKGGAIACRPRWLDVHDAEHWRPSDRLWLIALTGCSWSEAAGLQLTDDLGDHLALTQVWPRGGDEPRMYGKASARVPRDIPIATHLRPVLDRLASYSRSGYLLTGPKGQPLPYETWRNRLSASAKAAGHPDVTTHVLRHTAASLWIKAGAAPFLVMKAGDPASLDMVSKVYGHLWPSDVVELGRKKVDALDWTALD